MTPSMTGAFRILAGLNGLLLLVMFFYQDDGEDPAGAGIRIGMAATALVMFAVVVAVYLLVKWQPLRIFMLILLALPIIFTLYAASLMLG